MTGTFKDNEAKEESKNVFDFDFIDQDQTSEQA